MKEDKNKKKTLTISSNFNKKIDVSSIKKKDSKKSYYIEKKKSHRGFRNPGKPITSNNFEGKAQSHKRNLERKFVEQQATKAFIKKDEKKPNKNRLKLRN